MSLPAVMKHLAVLSDAGLVARTKTGRTVACRLDAEPMRDAFEWLTATKSSGPSGFEQSRRVFGGRRVMSTQTAVKPSLTLKRHLKAPPAKVFAAWIDPEKVKRWMGPARSKR